MVVRLDEDGDCDQDQQIRKSQLGRKSKVGEMASLIDQCRPIMRRAQGRAWGV